MWWGCLLSCAISAIFWAYGNDWNTFICFVWWGSTLFTKFNFLLTIILSCGLLSRDHNMKFCCYPPLMLIAFFLCLQELMHANIVPNDCRGLNHRMIVYSWPSNTLINMHFLHSLTSFYIQKLPFQSIYIR